MRILAGFMLHRKYKVRGLQSTDRACEVDLMKLLTTGGGGSSIVKVPGDVPPARVYFFGLLV